MSINQRIAALRSQLSDNKLKAYIIPSGDPHQSEYVPKHWSYREWISGFTGSAGLAIVSLDHAGLWADSRYFLQAEEELATSEFELHKMYNQFGAAHIDWLVDNLNEGDQVGIDPRMFSEAQVKSIKKALKKKNIHLLPTDDILSSLWSDQEPLSVEEVFELPLDYCGVSREQKLSDLYTKMSELEVDHHLVTTLDDIAWILNLRGNDVFFNPVFVSFLLISKSKTQLFIDPHKVSETIKNKLTEANIEILSYNEITKALNELEVNDSILIDQNQCNHALYKAINCQIQHGLTISRLLKAVKNETEIEQCKKALINDGVALTKFYIWLEQELDAGNTVSEFEAGQKIAHFRSQQEGYFGESFSAIVGYGGNGAIVHYRAKEVDCADITKGKMLLIDSGGQYKLGTTDITRTMHTGHPSDEEKNAYTRVLKGHIALDQAKFPKGTSGGQLDALARQFLWADGLNYLHGTGHGVGFFLNVHEAPQGFAPGQSSRSTSKMELGMITSNEPGYYKDHEFGIRIENLVLTVPAKQDGYYQFETITMFPIDTSLIDLNLMQPNEIKWLNDYHQKVYALLSPKLSSDEKDWLQDKCIAI